LSAPDTDGVVTVYIDFKNPKAYLAKDATFALEDELNVAFDWQPIRLSPLTRPVPARDDDDRGTQHRRLRAQYHEHEHRRYAARSGLRLGDLYRNPDPTIAGIGLLWSNSQSRAIARRYVDAVFARYWAEQLDLADASAIAGVLRDVGADVTGWDEYVAVDGRAAIADVQQRLSGAGVFDVPAYVVEGDVFFGRQHLPMIRWILSGRIGTPPL
jgi:2-hydroxychromene-2-carboxylate isomerase